MSWAAAGLQCAHGKAPEAVSPRAIAVGPESFAEVSPAHTLPDPGVPTADQVIAAFPDGTRWLLLGGMRVIERPNGAIERAREVLPHYTVTVVSLPGHLGGGMLLTHVTNEASPVWRVEGWLDRLEPVVQLWRSSAPLLPGFDRVYVRHNTGDWYAFDPRTGDTMPLGRLPLATRIGSIAFADAWRAAAITDLLGPLTTFDAGNSWHRITELDHASSVQVTADGALAFDTTTGRTILSSRGELLRDATQLPEAKASQEERSTRTADAAIQWTNRRRPLRLAIETGWPVSGLLQDDGQRGSAQAIFVDSGRLSRIRLSDGSVIDSREGALAADATCQAIPLGAGFGFVCVDSEHRTLVYEFVAPFGLREFARFAHSRALFASGMGGLVVRGPCDRSATDTLTSEAVNEPPPTSNDQARKPAFRIQSRMQPARFCFIWPGRGEREIVPGAWMADPSTESIRPVALRDGRAAMVLPPRTGRSGAVVLVSPGADRAERVPIVVKSPVKKLLSGTWLEGLEERSQGELGGWVDLGGQFVGVRISPDGVLRTGGRAFATDRAVVAGRFGVDWQGGVGQSVETTDGGFSWRVIDVPIADLPAPIPVRNACGPVGCAVGGWLRVGWGGENAADLLPPPAPKPFRTASTATPAGWALACQPTGRVSGPDRTDRDAPSRNHASAASPAARRSSAWTPPKISARPRSTDAADSGTMSSDGGGFRGVPPPATAPGDAEIESKTEPGSLVQARLYAWGARGADWTHSARYLVRFDDRFDLAGVRTTRAAAPPWPSYSAAAEAFGLGASASIVGVYALLDPAGSAILVARRGENRSEVYGLAPSEPAMPFHLSGEAFLPDPVSVARVGTTWFLLANGPGSSVLLHRVDGAVVRAIARLPRLTKHDTPRLVHRVRSAGLGLLVNGAAGLGERVHDWSVLPVDPETGALGDPIRLVASDLDGLPLRRCDPDDDGWWVDAVPSPLPSLQIPSWPDARLDKMEFRLRLDPASACVDSIAVRVEGVPSRIDARAGSSTPESLRRHALEPSAGGAGAISAPTASAEPFVARPSAAGADGIKVLATDRAHERRWELICHSSH